MERRVRANVCLPKFAHCATSPPPFFPVTPRQCGMRDLIIVRYSGLVSFLPIPFFFFFFFSFFLFFWCTYIYSYIYICRTSWRPVVNLSSRNLPALGLRETIN